MTIWGRRQSNEAAARHPLPHPQAVAAIERSSTGSPQGPVDRRLSAVGADTHTLGMDKIDGCPSCIENTETPYETHPLEGGVCCHYECSDCLHVWHTQYRTEEN